jgi:hypothetical protein
MLHFIYYTDSLPEMKEQDAMVMAQNLLVAAHRYNLQRGDAVQSTQHSHGGDYVLC